MPIQQTSIRQKPTARVEPRKDVKPPRRRPQRPAGRHIGMGQKPIWRHDHQDVAAHIRKLRIRFQTQTRGGEHPLPSKDHNLPIKNPLARKIIGRAQRFKNIGQAMIWEAIK